MCEEIAMPDGTSISSLGELKARFVVLREDYLDDDDRCPECKVLVDENAFCPTPTCPRFGKSLYTDGATGQPSTASVDDSCLCSVNTTAVLDRAGVQWDRDNFMGEPEVHGPQTWKYFDTLEAQQ